MFTRNAFAAPPLLRCRPIDLLFIVDGSRRISRINFNLTKSYLSQLVGRLDIDSGSTRVGLVTYASTVRSVVNLSDYNTVASVQSAISSLRYVGGGTNTGDALAYVRTWMLTPSAGDRSNVTNVVVVLTDGYSSNPSYTQVCRIFEHHYSYWSFCSDIY